jgi:hypothetical protein
MHRSRPRRSVRAVPGRCARIGCTCRVARRTAAGERDGGGRQRPAQQQLPHRQESREVLPVQGRLHAGAHDEHTRRAEPGRGWRTDVTDVAFRTSIEDLGRECGATRRPAAGRQRESGRHGSGPRIEAGHNGSRDALRSRGRRGTAGTRCLQRRPLVGRPAATGRCGRHRRRPGDQAEGGVPVFASSRATRRWPSSSVTSRQVPARPVP